jgi:endoglucanase
VPIGARVICLENSRAFAESPIGGGPIVRVGDRLSIFDPALTAACAKCAEQLAGGSSTPTASQKNTDLNQAWRWQRKLMAGGACEATVFCAYGYQATCLCLPLGNYHNMSDLAAVQAGTNTDKPKVGREYIGISDYEGLVDLLVACGMSLPEASAPIERMERLWAEGHGVLG